MTPTPRRPSRTQSTVLPFVRPVRPTGVSSLPPSAIAMLPLPENVTVVTDMVDLLWSVVATDRFGDRATLGMIHRRGPGFEATILADPIRTRGGVAPDPAARAGGCCCAVTMTAVSAVWS
jgi:hypothetical protein